MNWVNFISQLWRVQCPACLTSPSLPGSGTLRSGCLLMLPGRVSRKTQTQTPRLGIFKFLIFIINIHKVFPPLSSLLRHPVIRSIIKNWMLVMVSMIKKDGTPSSVTSCIPSQWPSWWCSSGGAWRSSSSAPSVSRLAWRTAGSPTRAVTRSWRPSSENQKIQLNLRQKIYPKRLPCHN